MTIEFKGRGFIAARVIADSMNQRGDRMMTYELEYPRFIHSEVMTHKMLSKNSASSRAIPIEKMHQHIQEYPQAPIHWGKNQSGMQAKEELSGVNLDSVKALWDESRKAALAFSKSMGTHGLHKQAANRITEPYMQMKVVMSGTEWSNFFWLRNHEDAQPEIQELAIQMWKCFISSQPNTLLPGEWHLPYVDTKLTNDGIKYFLEDTELSLDEAKMISASCCAQVSYRKNDQSIEKARLIFDRLLNSEPVHASPVEHQTTPIKVVADWREVPGVTHQSKNGDLWSGNLRGWIQYRQLIPNHAKMTV